MTKRRSYTVKTSAGEVKITPKFGTGLDCYMDGMTVAASARAAGLSDRHFRRQLARPQIKALIKDRAREIISSAAPKAARRLVELMGQNDAKNVAKDSAALLLGIEGIKPPQAPPPTTQVNIDVLAGFVIHNDDDARRLAEEKRPIAGYVIDFRRKPRTIEHDPDEGQSAQD